MIIPKALRLETTSEYYFSTKLQEVRAMESRGHDIINLGIGNPDMMPSAEAIKALSDAAAQSGNHGYQPYRSIPELRHGISAWYQRVYDVALNPDTEILPLIGSKEGITHITLAFVNPGDVVLVPELGYPAYRAVTNMLGGLSQEYPLVATGGWQPDLDYLRQADLSKVKLMWVNYPHMPTGSPPDHKVLSELIALARQKEFLLCMDNPYSLVLNETKPLSLLSVPGADAVALELNSMSKSHNMAGWRVGWVAGHKDYIDAIITIKSNVDSGMFKPVQIAAATALSQGQDWHDARNAVYRARRVEAEHLLRRLGCTWEAGQVGMFVWAKISSQIPSGEALVEHLLQKHHIFMAPGFIFGSEGASYIRISLCLEAGEIRKATERLKDFTPDQVH